MQRLSRFFSHHPLDFIPSSYWSRFFWPLLGFTIILMIVFGITGAPLTTTAAPYGVISFELAGSVENTHLILNSWDANTQLRAAFGLGLDFIFMIAYASTIAFGCGMAARVLNRSRWPLGSWGNLFSWAAILAALMDVIENIALTKLIFGSLIFPWPEIARWCAIFKFSLIFIGIVFVLYGAVVALAERISPAAEE